MLDLAPSLAAPAPLVLCCRLWPGVAWEDRHRRPSPPNTHACTRAGACSYDAIPPEPLATLSAYWRSRGAIKALPM